MTEEQLILRLKELKQIKPTKQWAFSLKVQLLQGEISSVKNGNTLRIKERIFWLLNQRKLAYSFAVLLLAFVGVGGFMEYDSVQLASVSQQSPVALLEIKSDVEMLKVKSQNLADIVNSKLQNSDEVVKIAMKEVKEVATNLTNKLQKNPQLAKTIALDVNNNKTYLNISGGNEVSEVADMYKAIADQLIKDLERATLTEEQTEEFIRIKNYYNNKDVNYAIVLRDMLLINASRDSKNN